VVVGVERRTCGCDPPGERPPPSHEALAGATRARRIRTGPVALPCGVVRPAGGGTEQIGRPCAHPQLVDEAEPVGEVAQPRSRPLDSRADRRVTDPAGDRGAACLLQRAVELLALAAR
jgi:hypothetical protein